MPKLRFFNYNKQSNPTSKFTAKENKIVWLQNNLFPQILFLSPFKITHSPNWSKVNVCCTWLDRGDAVCLLKPVNSGVWYSYERWKSVICDDVDESGRHCTKWNEPDIEWSTLRNFTKGGI